MKAGAFIPATPTAKARPARRCIGYRRSMKAGAFTPATPSALALNRSCEAAEPAQ